ncbi:MAG: ATP-grasp domain-containing protein [Flavobacteriales bacterium]|nr:ATP-grasp domain-containing protein [Flavobacteriales bacterium]MCB9204452.1 ATP-grasp domain-containing protein [Flavobacteriales bacterium]
MSSVKSINTILIANRGEIASRIIRTCKKMGIRSVALYSDADRGTPYTREADQAVHIGGNELATSYLDQDKIIATAQKMGADAIHPGFGFLSENAGFAKKVQDAGLIFIGPNPNAIDTMGSKSKAKDIMRKHEVPVIPGYQGDDQSIETLSAEAVKIGFPVLLKAAAGGGGKGMRIVEAEKELEASIDAAKREAASAFGDDELIIEKYFPSSRHIEFQIFGDKHGNAIHVLERECSIQRRYQKIIEESPSPALSNVLRNEMGAAAVRAAKSLKYDNAGTVEFILSDKNEFFFLEVNTRLQVEHPVTEEITGLDLVQMQIEVAEGRPLSVTQEDIKGNGYAIECRLYAEDAANNFIPATGKILKWSTPAIDGFRIETGVESGSVISTHYDPMIAKLITHGKDRAEGQRKMSAALANLNCLGLTTNQDFLKAILANADFQAGKYDTHFLQRQFSYEKAQSQEAIEMAAIAASAFDKAERDSQRTILQNVPSGWRNNFYQSQQETFLDGETEVIVKYHNANYTTVIASEAKQSPSNDYQVQVADISDDEILLELNGIQERFTVVRSGNEYFVQHSQNGTVNLTRKERFPLKEAEKVKGGYISPMPGKVIKVLVEPGQEVKSGEGLLVLLSMKMENTICADEDGTVEEIYVTEEEDLEAGKLLLKMKETE